MKQYSKVAVVVILVAVIILVVHLIEVNNPELTSVIRDYLNASVTEMTRWEIIIVLLIIISTR